MNVNPRRPIFNRRPQTNIYRMFVLVVMLLGGIWMIQQINKGEIKPLFQPTAIPTRSVESYALEGDANFSAGRVDAAILAYQNALKVNPNNPEIWWKLARIQTYSSAFKITNEEKKARLQEAVESARKAVELAPDDSTARAVLAFALDWSANRNFYTAEEVQDFLIEAETQALQAQQLDSSNALALAYYAEILNDQQKWDQAELIIKQALELDDSLMDVHRVYAVVLETKSQYNLAITEYDKAIAIEPNFTFLYLSAGVNYRALAFAIPDPNAARPVYEKSLEYFDRAVKINRQLGIKDPGPHLSIANTYTQLGEFFIAAENVKTALEYQPTNSTIYGQLGLVYFRSRNYEGSIFSLQCATYGCSGEDSCLGRGLEKCFPDLGENPVDVPGQAISPNTIVYYYTYGSVLAALSRPADNKCGLAMKVLNEVKAEVNANPEEYAESRDIILFDIVQPSEFICQSLAEGGAPASTLPAGAGDAMVDAAATPTLAP
ncbi:MAG: tetratricopeptide repeat protein [Chloroflexi bacterium]|nr:tetratricopeptide repeat protein [Chloroflexota bacterium]